MICGLGNKVIVQRVAVLCNELAAKGDQYVPVKLHVYEGIPTTN
jgi:hypothetical protein